VNTKSVATYGPGTSPTP